MNNIFVGNLNFKTTNEELAAHFAPFGTVASATVIIKQGKSLGYGFVDMPNIEEKDKAILELEGKELMGRALSVTVVVPRVRHKKKSKKAKPDYREKAEPPKTYRKDDAKPLRRDGAKPYSKTAAKPNAFSAKPMRKDNKKKVWDKKPAGTKPYYKKAKSD